MLGHCPHCRLRPTRRPHTGCAANRQRGITGSSRPCKGSKGRIYSSGNNTAAATSVGPSSTAGTVTFHPPPLAAAQPSVVLRPWEDETRFQDDGVHYTKMAVRDYELDQFSVVNNAVYASYLQHGRHVALQCLGMTVEGFQAAGTLMALSSLGLEYKGPLRAGDTFYVTTAVKAMSAARVVLAHSVVKLPGGRNMPVDAPQVVLEGEVTLVFLDSTYRPLRVPVQLKEVFLPLMNAYQRSQQQ